MDKLSLGRYEEAEAAEANAFEWRTRRRRRIGGGRGDKAATRCLASDSDGRPRRCRAKIG